MQRVEIRLPESTVAKLQVEADAYGRSLSGHIRQLLLQPFLPALAETAHAVSRNHAREVTRKRRKQ